MNKLPKILTGDRILDAVALPLLSVGQALSIGIGVFATREAFGALHEGVGLQDTTLYKLVGAGVLAACLEFIRRICAERLGQSYASSLRIVLYRHLAGMQKSELDARRLGALSLRFVGDLSAARNWYGQGLPRMISAAIVLPGALVMLWLLDPVIASIASAVLGATLLFMAIAATGFRLLHLRVRRRRASIAIAMMERIAIAPLLDLMGRTQQELNALKESGRHLRNEATARVGRVGALRVIPQIGLVVTGGLVLSQAVRSGIAPGTVAATLSVLGILALPLRDLATSWDQYNGWRVAKGKALTLLHRPSRLRERVSDSEPESVKIEGAIDGTQVSFSIPAGSTGFLQGGGTTQRSALALQLAGLDVAAGLKIDYGTPKNRFPRIHFVGDMPIALKGSLRRTLTLGMSPRPAGKNIARLVRLFGLRHLLPEGRRSLKGRVAEAARNVGAADSLRIEFVRIALANPALTVIDTPRLAADPEFAELLDLLSDHVDGTIVVVDRGDACDLPFGFQAMSRSSPRGLRHGSEAAISR